MTIVICDDERHENNTGVHVCNHIQSMIRENIKPIGKLVKVDFTYEGEKELDGYLCENCASSINVKNGEILELGDVKAENAFTLSSSLICLHCFMEKLKNA